MLDTFRNTYPPGPANGVWQSRQRGLAGIFPRSFRICWITSARPSSTSRHWSSDSWARLDIGSGSGVETGFDAGTLVDRDHEPVDLVALQREVAALQRDAVGRERGADGLGDQDLARLRLRGQVRGHVDRVAERGELAVETAGHEPDERRPGVDAGAEPEPRTSLRAVADGREQRLRRLHRLRRVLGPGHERDEESHDLVTDDLVQERVVREQGRGRGLVEPLHHLREPPGAEPSSELAGL